MTTLEDAPAVAKEIGRDRRRKEDQRLITGRTRWTDNLSVPGMLHLAMVRSPHAHAKIVSIDKQAANDHVNVVEVYTGADLADTQGMLINAWAITTEQMAPVHLPVAVDRVSFAGEIVAVVVARTPAEARDAAEMVDVEYELLPAALDLKEAAEDKVLAHPELGTNKSAYWVFDSGDAGTGGNAEEAIAKARTDGIVIEREYRQQRLIPVVHGAAQRAGRPDGRADHDVDVDPDPAHRPLRAGRHDRRPGVEDPRHRPRRGRWLRRQAPDHARGVGGLRDRPAPGEAGQVHRDPQREPDDRAPRSRPVAEADARRREGRHASPASRSSCSPTWARTSRSSAAASPCSAPSCSTPSTSSRPTTSPARRSSPTRPGPTPTGAPAGRRRRTPSSG